ncbi:hypothetical protein B0H19DRAFT_1082202 [Mycena capillaripes]|nr:hypothetical protein B0H19DRAFT_1082202 [Mycena capillaripes]
MVFDRAAEAPSTVDDGLRAFFRPLSLPSPTNIDFQFDFDDEELWPKQAFSEFQSRSPRSPSRTAQWTKKDYPSARTIPYNPPHHMQLPVSRWWRDGEGVLPDGSPPLVSRLESVSIDMDDDGGMSNDLRAQMQDLPSQGLDLHVEWR